MSLVTELTIIGLTSFQFTILQPFWLKTWKTRRTWQESVLRWRIKLSFLKLTIRFSQNDLLFIDWSSRGARKSTAVIIENWILTMGLGWRDCALQCWKCWIECIAAGVANSWSGLAMECNAILGLSALHWKLSFFPALKFANVIWNIFKYFSVGQKWDRVPLSELL